MNLARGTLYKAFSDWRLLRHRSQVPALFVRRSIQRALPLEVETMI